MSALARRHVAECGSTNDLARAWALDMPNPAPHGARVTADFQTQGRGRRGRSWDAARGQSVLLSVVLRPQFPPERAWQIAFLAGLAVSDVLAAEGLDPRLKWPNDVLLSGRKVAGILVETVLSSSPWAAVVGVGLNVNQDHFPDEARLQYPPTSLRLSTGRVWEVPALALAVGDALERRLSECEVGGWEGTWEACRRRLAVGAPVRRGGQAAVLLDLDADGAARVRLADGTFTRWASVEGEGLETAPNRV